MLLSSRQQVQRQMLASPSRNNCRMLQECKHVKSMWCHLLLCFSLHFCRHGTKRAQNSAGKLWEVMGSWCLTREWEHTLFLAHLRNPSGRSLEAESSFFGTFPRSLSGVGGSENQRISEGPKSIQEPSWCIRRCRSGESCFPTTGWNLFP